MDTRGKVPNDTPRLLEVAHELMAEARKVSDRALARLRSLRDRFPGDFSHGDLDFIEEMRAHRADERRRALRRCCRTLAVRVRVAGADAEVVPSQLIDRSPYGLGVRLPRSVEVGTFLEVVLAGKTGSPLLAEVKHCRQAADGWAIGCEILSSPFPM